MEATVQFFMKNNNEKICFLFLIPWFWLGCCVFSSYKEIINTNKKEKTP